MDVRATKTETEVRNLMETEPELKHKNSQTAHCELAETLPTLCTQHTSTQTSFFSNDFQDRVLQLQNNSLQ